MAGPTIKLAEAYTGGGTIERDPKPLEGAPHHAARLTGAAVTKAVDRAGFATISIGLRQCVTDPDNNTMDVAAMEKLFLSLA